MELTVTIDGSTEHPLIDGTVVEWDAATKMSRATLVYVEDGTFAPAHFDAILVKEGATTKFTGEVANIRKRFLAAGLVEYTLDCVDHVAKMDTTMVGKAYSGLTDRVLLQTILSDAGLDSDIGSPDAKVDVIKNPFPDAGFGSTTSVRQAFDFIADAAGGEWFLDGGADLNYNTEGNATAAAFDLSDAPDDVNTFEFSKLETGSVADELYNAITVVGGVDAFGRRIKSTDEDATSQSSYGTHAKPGGFKNFNVVSQTLADDWAAALLAKHKDPQVTGRCTVFKDGLSVGEKIEVTSADQGLTAETMLIRRLVASQINSTDTRYALDLGPDHTSQDRILRQIGALEREPGLSPYLVRGLEHDGINDYWFVSDNAFDDLAKITLSVWFYSTAWATNNNAQIARKSGDLTAEGWGLYVAVNLGGTLATLTWKIGTSGIDHTLTHDVDLIDGLDQWHHAVVAWDGLINSTASRLWLDGVETGNSGSGSGSKGSDVGENINVGATSTSANEFTGTIAQLAIWDVNIGDGDAKRLAAEPNPGIAPTIEPNHRIGFYRCDGYADGDTPADFAVVREPWNDNDGGVGSGTSKAVGDEKVWLP